MRKPLSFLLCLFAAIAVGCSKGDDGNDFGDENPGGNVASNSSPDMGKDNTTDVVVTGGVEAVGMTYADVLTYQNNWTDNEDLGHLRAGGYIGVYYGSSPSSLTKYVRCSSFDGRTIHTTIDHLEAGKTYYYQAIIGDGDTDFKGSEVGTFTTKDISFNGAMTATADNITFYHAQLTASVNTSSLAEKETFFEGLVYSKNKADLTGNIYQKLKDAESEAKEGSIEIVQPDADHENFGGFYGNGDMHFVVGQDMQLNVSMQPGNTFYYCPFIIIGGKSVCGKVTEATLRTLPEQTGFIDLGLSVLWDARNLGAETQFDLGNTYTLSQATSLVQQQYGNDARIPSREEVEELNKCKIEWIDNGVLITGLNGNQIFLPSEKLDQTSLVIIGTTGFHTTTTSWNSTFGYSYTYFDSNGEQMQFFKSPTDDARLVRLVSDSGGGSSDGTPQTIDDVVGTYTAYDAWWNNTQQEWEYYADYTITITAQYSGSQYLYITNMWNSGKTVEAMFNEDTGSITLFHDQCIVTDPDLGDLKIMAYKDGNADIQITYKPSTGNFSTDTYFLYNNNGSVYGPYGTILRRTSGTGSGGKLKVDS